MVAFPPYLFFCTLPIFGLRFFYSPYEKANRKDKGKKELNRLKINIIKCNLQSHLHNLTFQKLSK